MSRARPPDPPQEGEPLYALLMALRQARMIEVAALERFLGLPPSRPKRERQERGRAWHNEDDGEYKTA